MDITDEMRREAEENYAKGYGDDCRSSVIFAFRAGVKWIEEKKKKSTKILVMYGVYPDKALAKHLTKALDVTVIMFEGGEQKIELWDVNNCKKLSPKKLKILNDYIKDSAV